MLTSIHIQGFKGFKDTKIEPLRRVNLIVGGQNSGKTSLLEAITGGLFGKNVSLELNECFRSQINHQNFWGSLVSQDVESAKINLNGGGNVYEWGLTKIDQTTNLTQQPNSKNFSSSTTPVGKFNLNLHRIVVSAETAIKFDTKLIQTYSAWPPKNSDLISTFKSISEERIAEVELIKQLKRIDDRVEDIRFSPPNEVLLGMSGLRKRINIQLLGQGINRLAVLLFGLLTSNFKCAAIDEIENGIHYSALPTVWEGIAQIARELDIQLFITTHSYECIQAAVKVFEATSEEFQIIRLERTEDSNIKAILINDEKLKTAIKSDWEIR